MGQHLPLLRGMAEERTRGQAQVCPACLYPVCAVLSIGPQNQITSKTSSAADHARQIQLHAECRAHGMPGILSQSLLLIMLYILVPAMPTDGRLLHVASCIQGECSRDEHHLAGDAQHMPLRDLPRSQAKRWLQGSSGRSS